MRVSLQTVATHLELHRSTVSRALKNDPDISPETKLRVRIACRQMGYKPSAIISDLASSRWQGGKPGRDIVIAYISRAPGIGMSLDLYLAEAAEQLGYKLQVFQRRNFVNSAKLQKTLRNLGITDVILGPVYDESLSVELDWEKFICVQVLPAFFRLPLHSVIKDPFNTVLLAWEKAVSRGYQRIGVVLLDHPFPVMDDAIRSSAVYACQQHLYPHLPAIPPFRFQPTNQLMGKFASWVKAHRPDVIIGFSEPHYHIFHLQFKRTIPYINLHKNDEIGLSGIPDPVHSCARESINLLHFCRRTHQWGIPQERIDHVVEPTWFEGYSLPAKTPALGP